MIKQNKFNIIISSIITLLPMIFGFIVWGRLPWTLHDEENWNKTHKLAGKLWIISGIVMTVAGLLKFAILFMITIFVIVIIPTVYSYLLYRSKI